MTCTVLNLHGPGHSVVACAVASLHHIDHVDHTQWTLTTNGVGRAEVIAHGKVLARGEVNLRVARHGLVLRSNVDGGASEGSHGTLLEGELRTDVVRSWEVSSWENLGGKLTADHTVCGQLGHQHTVVVTCNSIGLAWRGHEPTSTNVVLNREAVASLEFALPWIIADRAHQTSGVVRARGRANGHVRVPLRVRSHNNHGRADVASGSSTEWALVEACGCADFKGELLIT